MRVFSYDSDPFHLLKKNYKKVKGKRLKVKDVERLRRCFLGLVWREVEAKQETVTGKKELR